MAKEPYKPQLRLIAQASIPLPTTQAAEEEYNNLKIFLLAISPDISLNGQIIKMLEPCCKDRKPTPVERPGFHSFKP